MKMKKMKLFGLMFLAGALLFSSCKKDEETVAPTISTSGASSIDLTVAQIAAGERVVFNINIAAAAEVETFSIKEDKSGTANATSVYDAANTDFSGKTEAVYNFDKTFVAADFDDGTNTYNKIVYTFTVSDKEGRAIDIKYTVNVVSVNEAPEISQFTAKVLGASGSASGSFLNATEGIVYTQNNAVANDSKIDLVYKWVTDAGLYSPDHEDVSTALTNHTVIGAYAGTSDFVNIDKEEIATLTAPTGTSAKTLAVGNILVFKTAGNKMGVLKVTALNNGTSGDMTVDVKVQN